MAAPLEEEAAAEEEVDRPREEAEEEGVEDPLPGAEGGGGGGGGGGGRTQYVLLVEHPQLCRVWQCVYGPVPEFLEGGFLPVPPGFPQRHEPAHPQRGAAVRVPLKSEARDRQQQHPEPLPPAGQP